MAAFADAVQAVAPHATGTPVTVTQAGRVVLHAFAQATGLTVIAIILLLIAMQRSTSSIVMTLAPLAVAALWTLAVAGLADIPFNFANVIVIPLLFALGVSSSIHMVDRGEELERTASADRYGLALVFSAVGGVIPGSCFGAAQNLAESPSKSGPLIGGLIQGAGIGQLIGPPIVAALVEAVGGWSGAVLFIVAGAAVNVTLALMLLRVAPPPARPAAALPI